MLYYTLSGEHTWDALQLMFSRAPLSFWEERRSPPAPPLTYFDRPDDPDTVAIPTPPGSSDSSSRAPSAVSSSAASSAGPSSDPLED